ncbi:hypothetical protein MCOR14_003686 [Pyricularia oryzae]|nr:hypothetical protein MCOR13_007020 [Pyricularia oryzae]KAI6639973.1 hypothetical protein MCOR14_003686 [Pyricularia oryzae]
MSSSSETPVPTPPDDPINIPSGTASPGLVGDDDDEDDPIVETYNVFLKPELPAHQQLFVLQHPNRSSPYNSAATELRLKPNSGMVELDMPLNTGSAYDKTKGVTWGKALSQVNTARSGNATMGLAGGFGVGAPPMRIAPGERRRRDREDDDIEVVGGGISSADFNEALRRDKVLRTQVLGGKMNKTGRGQTRYMVGVFSGENVHLTPITNLGMMRPQLHHIDAKADLERATRRTEGPGSGGGGSTTAAAAAADSKAAAARAIHMTVKSAGAVESDDKHVVETMADKLRSVHMEPWRRLAYVDESTDDAWALYEESFVHRGLEAAAAVVAGEGGAEGEDKKQKGVAGADGEGEDETARLVDRVPRLKTEWDEKTLMSVISGRGLPEKTTRGGNKASAMDLDD